MGLNWQNACQSARAQSLILDSLRVDISPASEIALTGQEKTVPSDSGQSFLESHYAEPQHDDAADRQPDYGRKQIE